LHWLLVDAALLPDNAVLLLLLLLLLTLPSAAIQKQHVAPCFSIYFVALPCLHPTQLANLTKACSVTTGALSNHADPRMHATKNATKKINKQNATNRMQQTECNKSMQQKECNKKHAAERIPHKEFNKKKECTKQNTGFQVLQGAGLYGAGDFLMSFLGVIILSFAFKIFDQRRLMVRHAPEILGSCLVSAGVSMLGTAVLCRLAGLDASRPSSAGLYVYSLFTIGCCSLQTGGL